MSHREPHHHRPLLIGAHTSAAGGVHHAIEHGEKIGATTIQLFTANQRQWHSSPIDAKEVERFQSSLKASHLSHLMSHASYLINLASPDSDLRAKSRQAFKREIERCHALDITYLNFHPGAFTSGSAEGGMAHLIEELLALEPLLKMGKTRLLLETTAGMGTTLGATFEELATILKATHKEIPIGVCIDTCHIFAAGYDIRDKAAWKKTLSHFDQVIGLSHLFALHVNDSEKPLGSKRDRHACLGKGEIGLEAFFAMMHIDALKELPKYLETPDPEKWADEIQMLRDFATRDTL